MSTKQVIVIRKDLNMRKGKMVAQGAHASMKAILDLGELVPADFEQQFDSFSIPLNEDLFGWLMGLFTKVCVSVNSEEELIDIYNKAQEAGLICSIIQDSGLTEFGGVLTYTAVAVGPAKRDKVDEITGHLNLL